ncbi:hypothetical protein F0A05_11410 [Salmonella enterica subsp. enterica serovar Typhimurium]|nr:hypothetical protein F0A05_11410 [Salmonella enterica subsp. enterica serovar Typhimurium]
MRQQQDEPGRFSICSRQAAVVHKSLWAAVIFWGGIAYFQWQVALVVGALFGLTCFIRVARSAYKEAPPTRRRKKQTGGFQDSYDFDQRFHIGAGDE